ncbi:hypothetical protein HELRODRAFT_182743 [Helobdella robusta]|uniref:Chromatin accessibility complex protein 1 n=1 Tax=Helobdella robusta TaxID=6412 RepID=T1FIN8_HELRO|nr:hypothetical protein HELRODRAFT_182743 [Helobdella robusta]ESN90139.1 hypothetical protein HELRODRAFT_182743 [Helobdella robusta]
MSSAKEGLGNCQLPISRIRTIMKSSPEVNSIGNDSLFLIAKATELFVQNLAQLAYEKSCNKELVDYNDLADIINKKEQLQFLQDIIPKKMKYKDYLEMVKKKEIIVIK